MHKSTINILVIKLIILLLPLMFLEIIILAKDPLRVFYYYDDFYKGNFVAPNRELVCLKLYQRNRNTYAYDSYIFGNSRSNAYKIKKWESYLPLGSKGFHFDAAGEGVFGIYNKVRYIDETGGKLRNVLLILDSNTLAKTKNRKGYLNIAPPELSRESRLNFYLEFLKPFRDFKFVVGYIDYSLFKTYRKYMLDMFNDSKYDDISDNLTGDLYYSYDKMIEEDKDGYYTNLINKGIFFDRSTQKPVRYPVSAPEKELLVKIRNIFQKHQTNYRIVVSPLYDQLPLGKDQLQLLHDIFGNKAVFDYSGVNRFTESIYNYYESSHYRPMVAEEIMKEIYWQTGR